MVTKDESQTIMQLINSLDEAEEKLEIMYFQKNIEGFESVKRFILNIHGKIEEIIK